MLIDLHTHSRFSDGTQSPTELMEDAASSGLAVIGLTDHDTTGGWAEALEAAGERGLGLVRGMEISCKYEGISVHLLSYLHDPQAGGLMSAVHAARVARHERTRLMVERLSADFDLAWDDVLAQTGEQTTIGRPHIADALVARGHAATRSEAFATILAPGTQYYVSFPTISPVEAISLVHEAGGVAVFAHPAASSRGRVVPEAVIEEFVAAGLDGIEIEHRDNPPEARTRLHDIARLHDLVVTGSSDYHGQGKPNRLAEHTTSPQALERIVERATGTDYLLPR